MVPDLLKTFKALCMQQRRADTVVSALLFRRALVSLFTDASDSALDNLAIDVEAERMRGTFE